MSISAVTATTGAPAPVSPRRSHPDALLYAVVLFIWVAVWRVQELWPILAKIQLPILTEIGTIALFLGDTSPLRRIKHIRGPLLVAVAVLLALMILGLPLSVWRGKTFTFLEKDFMPSLVLMVILATSIRNFADLEWLAFAHLVGATVYAGWIYLYVPVEADARLGNLVFYDANDFALLIACTLPFTLFFLRPSVRVAKRLVALLALCLFVVMLIKTGSRGGFLALIGVMLYALTRYTALPLRLRLGAVTGGLLVLTVFSSSAYWTMMRSLLHPANDYNMTAETGRKAVWKRGVGYMVTHPVLGVGARAFPQAEGMLSEISKRYAAEGRGLKWSAAHNSFVEVGAETGIIGLVTFLFLFTYSFRFLARVRAGPQRPAITPGDEAFAQMLIASLVGFIVAGFFVSAEYFSYLYVLLALVIAHRKLIMQRTTSTPEVPAAMQPQSPRKAVRPQHVRRTHWLPAG